MANDRVFGRDANFDQDLVLSSSGGLETVTGLSNLFQAIRSRLLTAKGDLASSPDYGIGLNNWLNKENSLENQNELAGLIQEELGKDDRIQNVSAVSIEKRGDSTFIFTITFTPVGNDEVTLEQEVGL